MSQFMRQIAIIPCDCQVHFQLTHITGANYFGYETCDEQSIWGITNSADAM